MKTSFLRKTMIAVMITVSAVSATAQEKVMKILAVGIADGETLYVRLYPYYGSAASGKTFCLKDVTIEGVATDISAPQAEDVTFGLTRELSGTTFAAGTENAYNSSPAITVTNILLLFYCKRFLKMKLLLHVFHRFLFVRDNA